MKTVHLNSPSVLSTLFSVLLCCTFGIALLGIAHANESGKTSNLWDEAAIPVHTNAALLEGTLDKHTLLELIDQGKALFNAAFTTQDGVGRPMATQAIIPTKRKRPAREAFSRTAGMDASACSSCHNQPIIGGAGDFVANVFVSEGFQLADFDTTDPQFSNERNTNHLFGAGLVELLAREMSLELATLRQTGLALARSTGETITIELVSKGVHFGKLDIHPDGVVNTKRLEGIDTDLIIKPFSQKGVITSLRQFSVNALNHHHGMQANERFGSRWTGTDDFDEDSVANEVTDADVSALVLWQATLQPPVVNTDLPSSWTEAAARGSVKFDEIGCNSCHQRTLPLDSLVFSDPGPMDAAGTLRTGENGAANNTTYDLALLGWASQLEKDAQGRWLVPLFGDLKRHVIADNKVDHLGNELLSQRFVERNVFMTAELWGIGSTAPYGHRGDLTTLAEIISAHGGDARESRDTYVKLEETEKSDITAFLKTLVINP